MIASRPPKLFLSPFLHFLLQEKESSHFTVIRECTRKHTSRSMMTSLSTTFSTTTSFSTVTMRSCGGLGGMAARWIFLATRCGTICSSSSLGSKLGALGRSLMGCWARPKRSLAARATGKEHAEHRRAPFRLGARACLVIWIHDYLRRGRHGYELRRQKGHGKNGALLKRWRRGECFDVIPDQRWRHARWPDQRTGWACLITRR
jgi:hypothetical protein